MLHRLIVKVTKFQFPAPKRMGTVVKNILWDHHAPPPCQIGSVHVPNFGGCQGRSTGVGVTTVSNLLILGGWVTKVLKNGDKK